MMQKKKKLYSYIFLNLNKKQNYFTNIDFIKKKKSKTKDYLKYLLKLTTLLNPMLH